MPGSAGARPITPMNGRIATERPVWLVATPRSGSRFQWIAWWSSTSPRRRLISCGHPPASVQPQVPVRTWPTWTSMVMPGRAPSIATGPQSAWPRSSSGSRVTNDVRGAPPSGFGSSPQSPSSVEKRTVSPEAMVRTGGRSGERWPWRVRRSRGRTWKATAPGLVRPARVALEVGEDGGVVLALGGLVQVGEEVLLLVARDVHRSGQPVVADRDEAVVALELVGDRLDQRVLLEGIEDAPADGLDDVEELLGVHLVLAGEE